MLAAEQAGNAALHQQREGAQVDDHRDDNVDNFLDVFGLQGLAADLNIRACKTGMLADAEHVKAIVRNLKKYDFGPLTVDPVMIAKGGVPLLSEDAISVVRDELVPLADLVTPNLPEAEKLTGMTITTEDEMVTAGKKLQALGAKNVLVKGGHFNSADEANDFVLLADGKSFWMTAQLKNISFITLQKQL